MLVLCGIASQALAESSWEEKNSAREDEIAMWPENRSCSNTHDCVIVPKLCSKKVYAINRGGYVKWEKSEAAMVKKKGSKITCIGDIDAGNPKVKCTNNVCEIID